MKETLGIYQFIRNATKYDYPFEESLRSAAGVADKIVVCECYSEDDTYERLLKIQKEIGEEKLLIVRREWVTHFTQLADVGNYAETFLDTDWVWQLQSDEVLHENSYPMILDILNKKIPELEKIHKVSACLVNYYHFLANYETEFDFCYKTIPRIARKGSLWKLVGDACHLADGPLNEVVKTPIMVYHYGKVHQGNVGWTKEWDFQQLFRDVGFPDPKMIEMETKFGEKYCDYVYLFEETIKEGKVREFKGRHPKVMEERIKNFKDGGWEQFQSKMKEGLKLK